jgi:hypothetical protein
MDPLKIQQSQVSPSGRLEGPRPNSIELTPCKVDPDSRSDSRALEYQNPEMVSEVENAVDQAIERPKKRFDSTYRFSNL